MDQTTSPLSRLRANTQQLPSLSPIVNTLSPATASEENPTPMPMPFQSSFGPVLGHFLSSPLSTEISSRLGPRNCGQSALLLVLGVSAGLHAVNEARPARTAPYKKRRDIQRSPCRWANSGWEASGWVGGRVGG